MTSYVDLLGGARCYRETYLRGPGPCKVCPRGSNGGSMGGPVATPVERRKRAASHWYVMSSLFIQLL